MKAFRARIYELERKFGVVLTSAISREDDLRKAHLRRSHWDEMRDGPQPRELAVRRAPHMRRGRARQLAAAYATAIGG